MKTYKFIAGMSCGPNGDDAFSQAIDLAKSL